VGNNSSRVGNHAARVGNDNDSSTVGSSINAVAVGKGVRSRAGKRLGARSSSTGSITSTSSSSNGNSGMLLLGATANHHQQPAEEDGSVLDMDHSKSHDSDVDSDDANFAADGIDDIYGDSTDNPDASNVGATSSAGGATAVSGGADTSGSSRNDYDAADVGDHHPDVGDGEAGYSDGRGIFWRRRVRESCTLVGGIFRTAFGNTTRLRHCRGEDLENLGSEAALYLALHRETAVLIFLLRLVWCLWPCIHCTVTVFSSGCMSRVRLGSVMLT